MHKNLLAATIAALFLTACDSAVKSESGDAAKSSSVTVEATASQSAIKQLAESLNFQYQSLGEGSPTVDCAALGAEHASCSLAQVVLSTDQDMVVGSDWIMYAHSVRRILRLDAPGWRVEHITGDLHRIYPPAGFKGFKAGEQVHLPMVMEFWQLFESDIMPNWYLTDKDNTPYVIAQTATNDVRDFIVPFSGDQWRQGDSDNNVLMTAATRFERNKTIAAIEADALTTEIIPTPLSSSFTGEYLDAATLVVNDASGVASSFDLGSRIKGKGVTLADQGLALDLSVDASLPAEGYKLTIADSISLAAGSKQGLIWGMQTLIALADKGRLPMGQIEDAPRYDYRGMQVDVGRHLRSLPVMKRLVEQMSAVKLNKLHLGLTNDEGWRIQIPGLPELTDIGGERCHDLTETSCLLPQIGSGPTSDNMGSGYYSVEQYVELVSHANALGIEVIPETNMPAHARAAVVSMEARYKRLMAEGDEQAANEFRLADPNDKTNAITVQFYDRMSFINPCLASSHRFVDKVITEVAKMHEQAGQPLKTWHYGGDEAKNIALGGGFEDINAADKEGGKGLIDRSKQDYPFGRSPACEAMVANGEITSAKELPAWFAVKVGDMVSSKGIPNFQAWQDGLKYASGAKAFSNDNVIVNYWETVAWGAADTLGHWGDEGYKVVLSSPDFLYFDFPYEVDPQERGYYWAARYIDLKRTFGFSPDNMAQNAETIVDRSGNGFSATTKLTQLPIGISGQQWGETVRTDAQFEYMVYPRLYPLAERAWHKADWELDQQAGQTFGPDSSYVSTDAIDKQFDRFSNLVAKRYLPVLDAAGVAYRIPVPGAIETEDGYQVNIDLPGLQLEYKLNGNWMQVEGDTIPKGASAVRATSSDGSRAGRELPLQ